MSCRFYKQKIPDLDDIVFVKVKDENEYGFHVNLLEYDGMLGFVSKSQLVKKRTRKKRIVRIGDELPMVVLSADDTHVNVSKRRLHDPDIPDFMVKYKFASFLNRICIEIYNMYKRFCSYKNKKLDFTPEDIASECVWKLVEDNNDSYETTYQEIVNNLETVFKYSSLPDEFQKKMLTVMNEHIASRDMLIETKLKLAVYGMGGVDTIKNLLNETKFSSVYPEYTVSIKMVSPPIYKIIVGGPDIQKGVDITEGIFEEIKKSIKDKKISFSNESHTVVKEPILQLKPVADYCIEHTEF